MKRIIFSIWVTALCGLFPVNGWTAPTISSAPSSASDGQSITISGVGFGSKSPAKPYLWAPFNGGSINPSSLGIVTSWDGIGNMAYNSSEGPNGSGCAKATDSSGDWTLMVASSGFAWNDYNHKMYLFRKIKRNFDIPSSLNWKVWRVWNTGGTYPDMYFQEGNGDVSTEGVGDDSSTYAWFDHSAAIGATNVYNTEEIILKSNSNASVADGYLSLDLNGTRIFTFPDKVDLSHYKIYMNNGSCGPMVENLIVHGVKANTTMGANDRYWADDVYLDSTWARVMIGDQSTWAASTHKEIQIPQSWSSDGTSIGIVVNKGTFTDGATAYLYVIDASGNVSPGKQITFGSTSSGSTPAAVKNLKGTVTSK